MDPGGHHVQDGQSEKKEIFVSSISVSGEERKLDYVERIQKAFFQLPDSPGWRGVKVDAHVQHDDECMVFKDRLCSCDPDITFNGPVSSFVVDRHGNLVLQEGED